MKLTEQQLAAIKAGTKKNLAVYACAGSGKTTLLTGRIKVLINNGHRKQLIITFTKKAAENIKKRLKVFPPSVFVGTFHGFCYKTLSEFDPSFKRCRLIDIDDFRTNIWVDRALTKTKASFTPAEVLQEITRLAYTGVSYENLNPALGGGLNKTVIEFYKLMRGEEVRTFNDLLVDTLELLKTNKAALQKTQERYPIVMVDEFQDTDEVQSKILQKICAPGHLTVVGDVSQAIYSSFRGCDPEFLLHVEKYFGPTTVINMTKNFRSGGLILSAANNLIANNKVRSNFFIDINDSDGSITVREFSEPRGEAQTICDELAEKTNYNDYAIIYRTNAQAALFESSLAKRKIPFDSGGAGSFFDMSEVKPLVDYLRLVVDPTDVEALTYVWNRPSRFLRREWLKEAALSAGSSSVVDILEALSLRKMSAPQRRKVEHMRRMFSDLQTMSLESPAKLLALIYNNTAYDKWLREIVRRNPKKTFEEVKENIAALYSVSSEFKTAKAFLNNITRIKENNKKKDKQVAGVSLMTIHRSKGLEFNEVYLIGTNDDMLPHHKSTDIEEERRLMYVAMTRPKKRLHISYTDHNPSRFIQEAGIEYENSVPQ